MSTRSSLDGAPPEWASPEAPTEVLPLQRSHALLRLHGHLGHAGFDVEFGTGEQLLGDDFVQVNPS